MLVITWKRLDNFALDKIEGRQCILNRVEDDRQTALDMVKD
jgi:hypothetical protein